MLRNEQVLAALRAGASRLGLTWDPSWGKGSLNSRRKKKAGNKTGHATGFKSGEVDGVSEDRPFDGRLMKSQ